ncbi:MAG: hydantoinase/oxoprolinase family protein [Rhodospirillaceae bacterium]|jgi:N-methylhydantoinase A|nr:hydantoinase/oxoprolinase family protein [Rhodospirillaceae bacterium]MBT5899325.1 hydantoinase/oxoprolinase family protein [Rhodospirillaceae bacterium]MBT7759478.1 hydantoinase/oxoprolinase family protein [Rhodospirillaceae bacterium]
MSWRVGVDIGGTFTDVALVDEETGQIGIAKVPTTPRDFGQGVVQALTIALGEHDIAASNVSLLSHATTVVTNAILEGKGANAMLVSTKGFRDVLELRRSSRSSLYDMFQDAPGLLIPRYCRLEVDERLDAAGDVVTSLDEADIDAVIAFAKDNEIEAIAVSLMFSFLNDVHERIIGEKLRAALPHIPVFLSSEVLPEIREFERASTTAVCAYVGPILESYLRRLEGATGEMGLPGLYVMGSSGGVFDVGEGLKMPAMAIESGPAAGVIAAAMIGRQLDKPNLLSFDMGGTTAKASLIKDGVVETTSEYEVGGDGNANRWMNGTGHPIRVPVIDLAEVSAGGGSIAWIDPGGALKVGPQSAGAEPGPVCYDAGGTRPTVTDCNLALGYLDSEALLAGRLAIRADKAMTAIEEHLASPLGIGVDEAAAGVLNVVNAAMAEALRIVSVERGHDAREFSLVAFGGAGPMHAAELAAELGIREVIVPPIPGGFSALGLVATDLKRDYVKTHFISLDQADTDAVSAAFSEMEASAQRMLRAAKIPEQDWVLERAADLRYGRQAYELTIPAQTGAVTTETLDQLARLFHEKHRQTYGHDNPDETIQLVNLRVTAIGRFENIELSYTGKTEGSSLKGSRSVWFRQGGRCDCAVHDCARLGIGTEVVGPAVIEAVDTTIVIPPGWRARMNPTGHILMENDNE